VLAATIMGSAMATASAGLGGDRAEHQGDVADEAVHRAIDRERGTSIRLRPEDNK
jgi:hypothetical protein